MDKKIFIVNNYKLKLDLLSNASLFTYFIKTNEDRLYFQNFIYISDLNETKIYGGSFVNTYRPFHDLKFAIGMPNL